MLLLSSLYVPVLSVIYGMVLVIETKTGMTKGLHAAVSLRVRFACAPEE
jgi:hypothetical protein